MTEAAKPVLTGGCQCGAVRYAMSKAPGRINICHCRMCQKATGAPFASYADIEHENFAWTRGKPASFKSSSIARIEILTGTFDRPDRVVPTRQFGAESRLGWVVGIANLPSVTTMQNYGPEKMVTIVSHQHPDHD